MRFGVTRDRSRKKVSFIFETDGLVVSLAMTDLWTHEDLPLVHCFRKIGQEDKRMPVGWGMLQIVFFQLAIHIGFKLA